MAKLKGGHFEIYLHRKVFAAALVALAVFISVTSGSGAQQLVKPSAVFFHMPLVGDSSCIVPATLQQEKALARQVYHSRRVTGQELALLAGMVACAPSPQVAGEMLRVQSRQARKRWEREHLLCGTSECNTRLLIVTTWDTWHSSVQVQCQLEISQHEDRGALTDIGNPSGAWGIGELENYNVGNVRIAGHLYRHVYAGPGSDAQDQVVGMISYELRRYLTPCGGEAHELAYGFY